MKVTKKSKHYNEERKMRESIIRDIIGYGNPIRRLTITEGDNVRYRRGTTIQEISDTGILTIYTLDECVITRKILRPSQLFKFFTEEELQTDFNYLRQLAIQHKRQGLNEFQPFPKKVLKSA